jgi:hypothetical protein
MPTPSPSASARFRGDHDGDRARDDALDFDADLDAQHDAWLHEQAEAEAPLDPARRALRLTELPYAEAHRARLLAAGLPGIAADELRYRRISGRGVEAFHPDRPSTVWIA